MCVSILLVTMCWQFCSELCEQDCTRTGRLVVVSVQDRTRTGRGVCTGQHTYRPRSLYWTAHVQAAVSVLDCRRTGRGLCTGLHTYRPPSLYWTSHVQAEVSVLDCPRTGRLVTGDLQQPPALLSRLTKHNHEN